MADQTEYRIVFPDSVTIDTANILRSRIVGALSQQDFGSLTILFSSEGGSTDQSMSLYNFIRQLPIAVHMHAVGHVGSAAFPIFLAADKRTSAKHARFFLHEYDWGFRDRQTLHRIQEATDRLKSDIALAKTSSKAERKFLQVSWPPLAETAPQPLSRQMMRKSTTLWETSVILAKPGESPFGSPEPAPSLISPILPQLDERSFGASVTHCILSRRCRSPACIAHMGSTAPAISLNTRHRG